MCFHDGELGSPKINNRQKNAWYKRLKAKEGEIKGRIRLLKEGFEGKTLDK
jgi:hypothetical protein